MEDWIRFMIFSDILSAMERENQQILNLLLWLRIKYDWITKESRKVPIFLRIYFLNLPKYCILYSNESLQGRADIIGGVCR